MNLGERGYAEETAPPAGVLPTAGTGHDGRRLREEGDYKEDVVEGSGQAWYYWGIAGLSPKFMAAGDQKEREIR